MCSRPLSPAPCRRSCSSAGPAGQQRGRTGVGASARPHWRAPGGVCLDPKAPGQHCCPLRPPLRPPPLFFWRPAPVRAFAYAPRRGRAAGRLGPPLVSSSWKPLSLSLLHSPRLTSVHLLAQFFVGLPRVPNHPAATFGAPARLSACHRLVQAATNSRRTFALASAAAETHIPAPPAHIMPGGAPAWSLGARVCDCGASVPRVARIGILAQPAALVCKPMVRRTLRTGVGRGATCRRRCSPVHWQCCGAHLDTMIDHQQKAGFAHKRPMLPSASADLSILNIIQSDKTQCSALEITRCAGRGREL
jgi:hypothetical protein